MRVLHYSKFIIIIFFPVVILLNPTILLKDLLPDDGECDWPADEFLGNNPRLLASSHIVEAATCSYCQDLAQILSVPVHLHDLSVSTVCGHTPCSLHR